eukprot:TRINITY_DN24978_c0_g1_i2.p1 TRINITY_DN24978_c0_g1~~TRINITY_DN24978_c0_g1_i2.p1  ORF type:complete len:302 (+),score=2.05 TRINITY_DN24978_c0_g1_i2:79-984(+)
MVVSADLGRPLLGSSKAANAEVKALVVPADGHSTPALRVWWCPEHSSSARGRPLVIFLHGGGLFSNATTYIPWMCPRFCRQCASSGKVCVEVDYPLSLLPWEMLLLIASGVSAFITMFAGLILKLSRCWLIVIFAVPWMVLAIRLTTRRSRRVRHPQHLKACKNAVCWATLHVAEFGADADQTVLWGHSAGGQLAALLALAALCNCEHALLGCDFTDMPHIAGLALMSAPLDYRPGRMAMLHSLARKVVTILLLREPWGNDPVVWAACSPMALLETAPTTLDAHPLPILLLEAGHSFGHHG